MRRGMLVAAVCAAALSWVSEASAWTPQAATYGVGETAEQTVTMADGTVLHANVYFPTDKATGKAADGTFPVIVTQTPYGKSDGDYIGGAVATLAGQSSYLISRGYIHVVADVRGTGDSQGEWGLFDPIQAQDGATLVNWAAKLPHSDGKVGLLGASYLGINQFLTAAAAGKGSPIKAMFPIIAGNDIYKDTFSAGGLIDIEFAGIYLGLTGTLNTVFPVVGAQADAFKSASSHIKDLADFDLALTTDVETGGARAYDEDYWQQRSPVNVLQKIVDYGIPAYLVGGWYDLFQRGEPLNYAGLQNAYSGRPVSAPMAADQKVTARYQLLQGPWYHVTAGQGAPYKGQGLDQIELAWFDHWLKDADTGITDTSTPLHTYDLATKQWREATRYPFDQATPTTYYLQPNGGLAPTKASGGTDPLLFLGTGIPCNESTEQWAAGAGQLALSALGQTDPCVANSSLSQVGPWQQSYTTSAFTKDTTLSGPIGAKLFAATTTADSVWSVQLSDVAPDGTPTDLTSGALEGIHRAVDSAKSWGDSLPWHSYTKAATSTVKPGTVNEYDVEVFPTFNTIKAGHKLRVTIATSDFPHALPAAVNLPNLLGGVYSLGHSDGAPSSVSLPLSSPDSYPDGTGQVAGADLKSRAVCVSKRTITLHVPGKKSSIKTVKVTVGGKSVKAKRVGKTGVRFSLAGRPKGTFTVRVSAKLRNAKSSKTTRYYKTCTRGKR